MGGVASSFRTSVAVHRAVSASDCGSGCSVRIGKELGSNKARAARLAAEVGVALGFALGLLITLFLVVLRHPLARCFTADPQLLALVGGAIVINAISLLGDAPQVRLSNAQRVDLSEYRAASLNLTVCLKHRTGLQQVGKDSELLVVL